nr:HipA domain-containing protein [Isoptericola chiayiensis]
MTRTAEGWARALDGYPSTHILKPVSQDHPSLIYDEEYGARLARVLGLAAFPTWIDEFDGVPALVVERYDRERSDDGMPRRMHQEDFNQALGLQGDQKYQKFGGKASLQRVARELAMLGDRAGLRRLARLTVLGVAVGNLDMHAKNLALLHRRDGSVELAPAYDVVPQTHQPNDGELALAVDRTYRHAAVTRTHLVTEVGSWGLRDAADLSTRRWGLPSTPWPASHRTRTHIRVSSTTSPGSPRTSSPEGPRGRESRRGRLLGGPDPVLLWCATVTSSLVIAQFVPCLRSGLEPSRRSSRPCGNPSRDPALHDDRGEGRRRPGGVLFASVPGHQVTRPDDGGDVVVPAHLPGPAHHVERLIASRRVLGERRTRLHDHDIDTDELRVDARGEQRHDHAWRAVERSEFQVLDTHGKGPRRSRCHRRPTR